MDKSTKRIRAGKRRLAVGIFLAAIAVGVVGAIVLASVASRKEQAKYPFHRVVEIAEDTEDPAVWGRNFPLQYDGYRRTVDQSRTRYGGSEAVPRTPTAADPRSVVAQSRLEEDPRLKILWAGYAFSRDFREERGHAFMLIDQEHTERQQVPQPGTCLNCHASMVVPWMKVGGGDIVKGFETLNPLPYAEARRHVSHPVACIDCHHPNTMELRVTRPAFMEGIARVKSLEGRQNYQVNRDASRAEMRTFVCAQCHVEYYFEGPAKRLTYPWANGLKADAILAYYERNQHKDWTHALTGAPALKAQHPEFELWSQGIHSRAGVSCADCHMPYQREGAMKVSDHHIRSPLLNVSRACQTCHPVPEGELKARAEQIQERTHSVRNLVMDAMVEFVGDLEVAARTAEAKRLEGARKHHRRAQFLLDFVEAENSTGFHAPGEALRILNLSLEEVRKGQRALSRDKSK